MRGIFLCIVTLKKKAFLLVRIGQHINEYQHICNTPIWSVISENDTWTLQPHDLHPLGLGCKNTSVNGKTSHVSSHC